MSTGTLTSEVTAFHNEVDIETTFMFNGVAWPNNILHNNWLVYGIARCLRLPTGWAPMVDWSPKREHQMKKCHRPFFFFLDLPQETSAEALSEVRRLLYTNGTSLCGAMGIVIDLHLDSNFTGTETEDKRLSLLSAFTPKKGDSAAAPPTVFVLINVSSVQEPTLKTILQFFNGNNEQPLVCGYILHDSQRKAGAPDSRNLVACLDTLKRASVLALGLNVRDPQGFTGVIHSKTLYPPRL